MSVNMLFEQVAILTMPDEAPSGLLAWLLLIWYWYTKVYPQKMHNIHSSLTVNID
jgi:hypothetical protein